MSPQANEVLAQALQLSPPERAELIERILDTFSLPDREAIDERWAVEAEERIEAYERGEIPAKPSAEVFGRIEHGNV